MATVRGVGVRPTGDDQKWKAEVKRVIDELIKELTAKDSEIQALKKRVK